MFTPFVRAYRWLRFRHGHGVHSPFAFTFVNDVVEEKSLYYAYKEIADRLILRRQVGEKFPNENLKNNLLFYRIAQFYKVKNVVLLGCETVSTPLYFKKAGDRAQCIYIDVDQKKINSLISLVGYDERIHVLDIACEDMFRTFVEKITLFGEPEIVYIHHSIPDLVKQKVLEVCSKFRNEQTIVLIDAIMSPEAKAFWRNSITDKAVSVSFDLIKLGILVYNSKLQKQNYKLYF